MTGRPGASDGGLVLGIVPDARTTTPSARRTARHFLLYTDGVTDMDGGDEWHRAPGAGAVAQGEDPSGGRRCSRCEFCRGSDLGDDITMVVVQRWAEIGTGEGTHAPR
jgi:hypothetical protein